MLNHTTSSHYPKQVQEIHETSLFQSSYSDSNHQKQNFEITASNISYSLIKPQLFVCTPTFAYKFHALAVYQHPTFTALPIRGTSAIQINICSGPFFVNIVNVLRPLGIFTAELHCKCLTGF